MCLGACARGPPASRHTPQFILRGPSAAARAELFLSAGAHLLKAGACASAAARQPSATQQRTIRPLCARAAGHGWGNKQPLRAEAKNYSAPVRHLLLGRRPSGRAAHPLTNPLMGPPRAIQGASFLSEMRKDRAPAAVLPEKGAATTNILSRAPQPLTNPRARSNSRPFSADPDPCQSPPSPQSPPPRYCQTWRPPHVVAPTACQRANGCPKPPTFANASARCASRWYQRLSARAGVPSTPATQVSKPEPSHNARPNGCIQMFHLRALRIAASGPPRLGPQMSQKTGAQGRAHGRSRGSSICRCVSDSRCRLSKSLLEQEDRRRPHVL